MATSRHLRADGDDRVADVDDRLSDDVLQEPCNCLENPDGFWTVGSNSNVHDLECLACERRWSP